MTLEEQCKKYISEAVFLTLGSGEDHTGWVDFVSGGVLTLRHIRGDDEVHIPFSEIAVLTPLDSKHRRKD